MHDSIPPNVQGYLTIFGAFLVQFTLGTLYTFGNMNPYITSYFRKCTKDVDVHTSKSGMIFAMTFFGMGFSMYWAGVLDRKIGPRLTTLIGAWFMSLGVILTYFTVKVGLIPTVFTYGLMFGLGSGIAYADTIATAMSWFPRQKGLAVGIVLAGYGSGSIVFDQVQTRYINPKDLKPNISEVSEKLFDNIELLERVPFAFLITGGTYMALQLIGILMISKPVERRFSQHEAQTLIHPQPPLPVDLRPYEVVKKPDFWILWFTLFFNSVSVVIIFTLYKVFGEFFIKSDHFLALVGSMAAVFNAGGRIMWGRMIDYISYKWLMAILTVFTTALQVTFAFSDSRVIDTDYMYLFWVCLLFGGLTGVFALCPAVCSNTFGQKYVASNFGILYTALATASFTGVFIVNTLIDNQASWYTIFTIGGICSFSGFVCNLLFRGCNPFCRRPP